MTARLGLGTAQLGLDYGVAGTGKVRREEARRIVERAAAIGVTVLDTAPAYGVAEAILGELPIERFDVVTKTVAHRSVRPALVESLARLRLDRCAGLLVHDRLALLDRDRGDALFEQLRAVRDEGLVERIGVSVYHPEEVDALLERYPLEIVQLPLNVLDQRALDVLPRLRDRGVEVHARSVYLQGLLLMEPAAVPAGLSAALPHLEAFRARAADLDLTPAQAALAFVFGQPEVDVVVCGVDRAEQVDELSRAEARSPAEFVDLAIDDRGVLDPSRWGLGS